MCDVSSRSGVLEEVGCKVLQGALSCPANHSSPSQPVLLWLSGYYREGEEMFTRQGKALAKLGTLPPMLLSSSSSRC